MSIKEITFRIIRPLPYVLLLIVSLVVLLTFIGLGQYAQPSVDDFCMASGVKDQGLMRHLWEHYAGWSGRYSGNALYAIYPLVFGMLDGYRYMPALLILSLLLACAYFLSRLFRIRMSSFPIVLVSLCFICIYLPGLKHTASSLYWMAGALSYQSANILFLLTLGLVIQLMDYCWRLLSAWERMKPVCSV